MKKVFLYAYDHINLGDDLFLYAITSRYPNVQFYLWSEAKNKKIYERISNLKVVDKYSNSAMLLKKIRPSFYSKYQEGKKRQCDAVVYIGGSIFMEYPQWENIVSWWNYQGEHYKFFVLGSNFGPYETEEYKVQMGQMMNQLQDVCFRDQYSYQLFKECKKARYAPDILFQYELPKQEAKKQIFISMIDCESREKEGLEKYTSTYIQTHCEIIKRFLEKGYQIKLVSFCEEEGDEKAINQVMEAFSEDEKQKKIEALCYNGDNLDKVLTEMAASEYIIGTRFHATVLGLSLGKKVFPFIYSKKTLNILNDLEYQGKYAIIQEIDANTTKEVIEQFESDAICNVEWAKRESEKQFAKLDEFLR